MLPARSLILIAAPLFYQRPARQWSMLLRGANSGEQTPQSLHVSGVRVTPLRASSPDTEWLCNEQWWNRAVMRLILGDGCMQDLQREGVGSCRLEGTFVHGRYSAFTREFGMSDKIVIQGNEFPVAEVMFVSVCCGSLS